MLAIAVVLTILSAVLTPRPKPPPDAVAQMFKDVQFPVPDEGTPQSVVFGDCWTPDWQVIWYGNMRTEDIHASSSSSGKK
jgi:hypothetical protein